MMSDLLKIQTAFRDNIQEDSGQWLSSQVEDNGIDSRQRLRIYENNVILTLTEALASNFPTIERLVGRDFFKFIAKKYILDNLPQTPLLKEYGGDFSAFLAEIPALKGYPYMQDIADLELNWREAYHAKEGHGLCAEEFWKILLSKEGDFLKDDIFIEFIPSFTLMKSIYPVAQIWSNNQADTGADTGEEMTMVNEPCFLAIFKNDKFEMNMHNLTESFYDFLEELNRGSTLVQAADRFFEISSDLELPDILVQLAELNITSTIKLNKNPNK